YESRGHPGMRMAEVDGAKAGQKIDVFASLIVPDPRSLRAHEDTPIAKHSQQLDERGITVPGERADDLRGGKAHDSTRRPRGRPSSMRASMAGSANRASRSR